MLNKLIAHVLLFALATAVTTTTIPLMYGTDEWSAANTEAPALSEEFGCRRAPNRHPDCHQVCHKSQQGFLESDELPTEETLSPMQPERASRAPTTSAPQATAEIANRSAKSFRLIPTWHSIKGEAVS